MHNSPEKGGPGRAIGPPARAEAIFSDSLLMGPNDKKGGPGRAIGPPARIEAIVPDPLLMGPNDKTVFTKTVRNWVFLQFFVFVETKVNANPSTWACKGIFMDLRAHLMAMFGHPDGHLHWHVWASTCIRMHWQHKYITFTRHPQVCACMGSIMYTSVG